jgi:hypothetical protein
MNARTLEIWFLVALLSSAGSCVTAPDAARSVAPGESQVRVEVYQGLRPGTIPDPELDVLVDITPLLGPDEVPGPTTDLTPLAESFAGRIASLLPAGQSKTRYHGFQRIGGSETAPACPEPDRETFAVAALDALREKLAAAGTPSARIVLVSDVSAECTPLLCAAAQRMAASGTWLDLVQIGPGTPPQCLSELRVTPSSPAFLKAQASTPAFRIETLETSTQPKSVLARGNAQADPVAVSPGLRMIVVELSPEEQIGPILLQDRQRTRVRLMDFPLSAPGRREWVVEVER